MKSLLSEFEGTLCAFLTNNFYKCRLKRFTHEKSDVSCDYSLYVIFSPRNKTTENKSTDSTSLTDLIPKLREESNLWNLTVSDVHYSNNHISISLQRIPAFFHGISCALHYGNDYGKCTVFSGKRIWLTTDVNVNIPKTLTELRIKLAEGVLERVLVNGEAVVFTECKEEGDFDNHIHLGYRFSKKLSDKIRNKSCSLALVTVVSGSKNITSSEYKTKRKESLKLKTDVMCKLSEDEWNSLADLAVLYDLLKTKLSKCVMLPKDFGIDNGAIFVVYNYARLSTLLKTFEEKFKSGVYPKLPELNEVDLSFLSDKDEWQLLFDYVLTWPDLLIDVVNLNNKDSSYNYKIHTVVSFLHHLSMRFSSYYCRVQILTEARPQLLSYMFARIYLLKAVLQVMTNCFTILGIKPLSRM